MVSSTFSSSSSYWWVIWLMWEMYAQEQAHFLHTDKEAWSIPLSAKRLNKAAKWRLKIVGEAAQSPTGSDLMSIKTCACFRSVSFLLCSDRDFLFPVGMDMGVIRPSIPPTAHGNIILQFCCHVIHPPSPTSQTLFDINAKSHKECVRACVRM